MFLITHLLKPLQEIYKTSQWKTSKLQSLASKFGECIFCSKSTNSMENVGIVKGIQQMKTVHLEVKETFLSNSPHSSPKKNSYCGSDFSDHALESPSHRVAPPYKDPPAPPPYRDPPPPSSKKNVYQVIIVTIFVAWRIQLI